jgi:hypothetical protein
MSLDRHPEILHKLKGCCNFPGCRRNDHDRLPILNGLADHRATAILRGFALRRAQAAAGV